MKLRFKDLAKGARFKYPDGSDVWVVLENFNMGLVAKWEGPRATVWQSLCCFVDDDEWTLESEVEVVFEDQCEVLTEALRAICLTRDYVGGKSLPAIVGWEWYDAGMSICEKLTVDNEWVKDFKLRVDISQTEIAKRIGGFR